MESSPFIVILGIAAMLCLIGMGIHVAIVILIVSFLGLSLLLGVSNSLTFLMTTPFSAAMGLRFCGAAPIHSHGRTGRTGQSRAFDV